MAHSPSIAIHTLGCKLNQAESEELSRLFVASGYEVSDGRKADIFIINTCTVTHTADSKSRHLIRLLRKNNPGSLIVVTGCYAERAAHDLIGLGVDLLIGNEQKMALPQMLKADACLKKAAMKNNSAEKAKRMRSFIKIQDGCTNYCTYCIVPYVRSDVYSIGADTILAEIKARYDEGYKEVVLTGTEIGSYDDKGLNLARLVELILQETFIQRIHLSSLQPQHINNELLNLWDSPRLIRHFHMAMQSGSNAVLSRMHRRYNTDDYAGAVDAIRRKIPDASITSDCIVGFPGESNSEFEESYGFFKNLQLSSIHVFSYSSRKGTAAAEMKGKVSAKIQKERSNRMLRLANRLAENYSRSLIGRVKDVLWENEVSPGSGTFTGLTDNYVRVYCSSIGSLTNMITRVKLAKPVSLVDGSVLKGSMKSNSGELWSEVLNETNC